MKYFTKTAVSAKMLGKALRARNRYVIQASRIIPRENPLRQQLLKANKAQIEQISESIFGKGWYQANMIEKSKSPREAIARTRKALVPSDQFKELGKAKELLESKGL